MKACVPLQHSYTYGYTLFIGSSLLLSLKSSFRLLACHIPLASLVPFVPPPQSAFYIHRLNIYMHICKFKSRFCIQENLWTGWLSEFGLFCLLHILISNSICFPDDIILYNWVKFHSVNVSCCLHVRVDRPVGSLVITALWIKIAVNEDA